MQQSHIYFIQSLLSCYSQLWYEVVALLFEEHQNRIHWIQAVSFLCDFDIVFYTAYDVT